MIKHSGVGQILKALHESSDIIADAFEKGRIEVTEDTAKSIMKLNQLRILTPDIHNTFQLRHSMRKFLNTVLNTSRLMEAGTDLSKNFSRLDELVTRHNNAFMEGREDDSKLYEEEIRESINDIAGDIEDELLRINRLVDGKFATVTTLSEKVKENEWYLKRTETILAILETFSFSDIGDRLKGHHDLELAFNLLLKSKMGYFLITLKTISEKLGQFLYTFRNIEARAKLLRSFANHINKNPNWQPRNWDEQPALPDWISIPIPLSLTAGPDINSSENENELSEIASNLPEFKAFVYAGKKREAGILIEIADTPVQKVEMSGLQRAVQSFVRAASISEDGMSARDWWMKNPSYSDMISEEYWVRRILSEKQNRKIGSNWQAELISAPVSAIDGNVVVKDIVVSKGRVSA